MPERYIYGEEPPEEEGSIVGKVLGQLGSAFASIPGVDPALKGLAWTAETGGGVLSATIRGKGLDVLGIGEQDASDSYLGIDERDDIWGRLQKTRAWQRDRQSAFWGEKFLSEVAGDPLTYLPIGTGIKWARYGIKSLRSQGISSAGQGVTRVSLSPTISAAEMRYTAGMKQHGIEFDLPTPTNSTQFYGPRHVALQRYAKDLIEQGTRTNNPDLITKGEGILDDILEEPASYIRDYMERAGYKNIDITTSRYGEATKGLVDRDAIAEVMPTIFISAKVADDKVDDFVRTLADISDVDFGRTSMVVHQKLRRGVDATFREVKYKAKKGAALEGTDYAVAPMVSMMTKGGQALTHGQVAHIQDIINTLSVPASGGAEGRFTPSGLFIASPGGAADEPLSSLLGFNVRPDGKGIELIHLAGLDTPTVKSLGKTEIRGVNKNIKVQSKEEAGQKFIESVKKLQEAIDDIPDAQQGLRGLFDQYEVGVRAVRHYGRKGAGDTTDKFTSSYDKFRRYHDAQRGEAAGEKAGLSRKQRRTAGRRNYQQWQQRVGDAIKTNLSPVPGTERLGFTVPLSTTGIKGAKLIWPTQTTEQQRNAAIKLRGRLHDDDYPDLADEQLIKMSDEEMIREYIEDAAVGDTYYNPDNVAMFRVGDAYIALKKEALIVERGAVGSTDDRIVREAFKKMDIDEGSPAFYIEIIENPTKRLTHEQRGTLLEPEFGKALVGKSGVRQQREQIPKTKAFKEIMDEMSLANPDIAMASSPIGNPVSATEIHGAIRGGKTVNQLHESLGISAVDIKKLLKHAEERTSPDDELFAPSKRARTYKANDAAWINIYPETHPKHGTLQVRPHAKSPGFVKGQDRETLTGKLRTRLEEREALEAEDALRAAVDVEDAVPSPTMYGDVPSDEVIRGQSRANNALRKITRFLTRKETGIPMVRGLVHRINPDGLIDAAKGADPGAKAIVDFERTADVMDSVITADIAALKRMGKTSKHFKYYAKTEGGATNLFIQAQKIGEEMAEHPLQSLWENTSSFDFTTAGRAGQEQLAYIQKSQELLDGWYALLKREGIDVGEISKDNVESYFPRFMTAIRDVENARSARSGRGGRATVFETRLHEAIEEGITNGVEYFGAASKDPIADIVETYMTALGRAVNNQRLANKIKPMGSTLNERILGDEVGRGLRASISRQAQLRNYAELSAKHIGNALRGLAMTSRHYATVKKHSVWMGEDFERILKGRGGKKLTDAQKLELKGLQRKINADVADRVAESEKLRNSMRLIAARLRSPLGMEQLPKGMPGAGAYSSRLFSREVVEEIAPYLSVPDEFWGKLGTPVIGAAATFSAVSRSLMLTLDFGAGMLQGAMVLANSPQSWAPAFYKSMRAVADPTTRWRYIDDNREVLAQMRGLHLGSTEFTEIIRPGGKMEKWTRKEGPLGKVPIAGAVIGAPARAGTAVLARAGESFETFFDVARIQMAKAWMPAIKSGKVSSDQVANMLNKMTGILSSRALGVGATQREIESAIFTLAPRWFRATTALFADALQGPQMLGGTFEGGQAIKNLTTFFGGTVALYIGLSKALGQEPKLDPRTKAQGGDGGQFMTVEVGGQHIGLAGKPYSMARTLIRMGKAGRDGNVEEQYDIAKQFFRSQAAPVSASLISIIDGEDFMGNPVESTGEIFTESIASRMMPFYASSMVFDDPRPSAVGVAADVFGLKSWPIPPEEELVDMRDALASHVPSSSWTRDQKRYMDDNGMTKPNWKTLDYLQKRKLLRGEFSGVTPRMLEMYETLDKRVGERGRKKPGNRVLNAYFEDIEDARADWEHGAMLKQDEVDDGEDSPMEFKEKMQQYVTAPYAQEMQRLANEDHVEAREMLATWQGEKEFIPMRQLAYTDYLARLVGNPDLEDEYENYDFDAARVAEDGLRKEWGDKLIDEMKQEFIDNKKAPRLWKRWVADRDVLRPYWEVRNKYLETHPEVESILRRVNEAKNRRDIDREKKLKRDPDYRRYLIETGRLTEQMRRENPILDGIMVFWGYANKPLTATATRQLYAIRSQMELTDRIG